MSAILVISEPKSFSLRSFLLQRSMLGVPLAIWAISLLVIVVAAHLDLPVITFGSHELVATF